MENHPIPQDVTGFKFRLIGSMTVKQFLYLLAAGALCGLVFILPISFLIKWPIIITIASIGAGFAFVPVEGRPMDVMLVNFLKALPAENRYIFHKKGAGALLHNYFMPQEKKAVVKEETVNTEAKRRELLLNQLVRKTPSYKPDEEEREKLSGINDFFQSADAPVTGMPSVPEEPVTEAETVQKAPTAIAPLPANIQRAPVKADLEPELQKDIAPIVENAVPQPVSQVALQPKNIGPSIKTLSEVSSPAKTITPEAQVESGFPQIPDTPNIVLGIVKDARNRVLPNIIVEVVDESRNPVRAFKTNALGQFSSATPLPNGKYQILLEDTKRQHEFSPIDIEMEGEIFQPLEIVSVDQREKLRQELFGNATSA